MRFCDALALAALSLPPPLPRAAPSPPTIWLLTIALRDALSRPRLAAPPLPYCSPRRLKWWMWRLSLPETRFWCCGQTSASSSSRCARWPAWKCNRHPCIGSHPGTSIKVQSRSNIHQVRRASCFMHSAHRYATAPPLRPCGHPYLPFEYLCAHLTTFLHHLNAPVPM